MKYLFVILLFSTGCCPIGCDEAAVIRPAGTVTIVSPSGPIGSNVKVRVQRFHDNPHWMPDQFWDYETRGDLEVVAELGEVTQYPLMMHGVGTFAWQVCAESQGKSGVTFWASDSDIRVDAPRKNITVTLDGEGDCATRILDESQRYPLK